MFYPQGLKIRGGIELADIFSLLVNKQIFIASLVTEENVLTVLFYGILLQFYFFFINITAGEIIFQCYLDNFNVLLKW